MIQNIILISSCTSVYCQCTSNCSTRGCPISLSPSYFSWTSGTLGGFEKHIALNKPLLPVVPWLPMYTYMSFGEIERKTICNWSGHLHYVHNADMSRSNTRGGIYILRWQSNSFLCEKREKQCTCPVTVEASTTIKSKVVQWLGLWLGRGMVVGLR